MVSNPFVPIDASAPEWAWPQLRPSFFAYGESPPHYPSDDLSRSAFEAGGSWIYVTEGRFFVKNADGLYEVCSGSSVLFTNPATVTLVYPEAVTRVVVGIYGSPTAKIFEWLIARYGSFHQIPRHSPAVTKAIALYHTAQRQSCTSAHIWSTRLYDWTLSLWRELEKIEDPAKKKIQVMSNSRVLGMNYPNFKNFAKAMGYDPAYLSRSLEKSWGHRSPARILRLTRLQKAESLLRTGNLSVRQIAREVCYSGPDAFAAAFRKVYGMAPLRYRHAYRLGIGSIHSSKL